MAAVPVLGETMAVVAVRPGGDDFGGQAVRDGAARRSRAGMLPFFSMNCNEDLKRAVRTRYCAEAKQDTRQLHAHGRKCTLKWAEILKEMGICATVQT